MNNAVLSIAISELQSEIRQTEGDMVAKMKVSMKYMRNHWMITNEDEQFRAAVGGVLEFYGQGSEEWMRLEEEMTNIKKASALVQALQAGIPVDVESMLEEQEIPKYEPIGLLKLWHASASNM